MYHKAIAYDRHTRDFAMYLDGELIGFARTHHEAEITLDEVVFELLYGPSSGEQLGQPEARSQRQFYDAAA